MPLPGPPITNKTSYFKFVWKLMLNVRIRRTKIWSILCLSNILIKKMNKKRVEEKKINVMMFFYENKGFRSSESVSKSTKT